jgi:hypothetical protein
MQKGCMSGETEQANVEVTLYTCIWEVLDSNLGWDTNYPE